MTADNANLMLRAARAFTESGLSVVPADVREKRPRGKWKQYQARIAEPGQLTAWFEKDKVSIGVITGRISHNLEVLDHDDKELWPTFCSLLESQAPGLLARLPIVQTQSGNHHIFYRCKDREDVAGNLKLARVPGNGVEWSTSIETRGEGGFVVTAPSKGYRMLQGKLTKIPIITAEERQAVLEAARAFDRMPAEHVVEPADKKAIGENGSRPGDDYNDRADVGALLAGHGWTVAHSQHLPAQAGMNGQQVKYLRRPGKQHGHSATLGFLDGKFYVFSSNAGPFQAETSYSKFAVYALLEHGGDYAEAARALSLQGYGQRRAATATGAEPEEAKFYRCTDTGNGQRLADQHGRAIRYSYVWRRWLYWTGKRWKIDESGEIDKLAKETVASIALETVGFQDKEVRQAVEKWRRASESKSKHHAMLFMAQSELGIPVSPQDLDADLWALNVNNGTINLQTGKLLAHDPARLITKLAPVDYEPQARCPLWLSFLERIMAGNQELIGFLQRAVGYALTGSIREQVIFILHGIGANGKSTALETISSLLDDYAARTPTQTLLLKRNGGAIPNDIARLKGARFVTVTEVEAGRRLAEGLVKQMTGGEKMVARFLHAEFFEFSPEFKLFLATNHKPEIRGTDHAIWRRIRLIPFEVVIPDAEQDKDLPGKLRQELPGILNWALAGCLDWQKSGLRAPQAVTEATSKYREDMDLLADFLLDRCYEKPSITTTVAAMFKAYTNWAEESNEKALTKRAFGLRLRERGFEVKRITDGVRVWQNIGLTSQPNQKEMEF